MSETTQEILKISPPMGVGGLSLFSVQLSDWVLILTLIYTVVLIFDKIFPGVLQKLGRWLIRKSYE